VPSRPRRIQGSQRRLRSPPQDAFLALVLKYSRHPHLYILLLLPCRRRRRDGSQSRPSTSNRCGFSTSAPWLSIVAIPAVSCCEIDGGAGAGGAGSGRAKVEVGRLMDGCDRAFPISFVILYPLVDIQIHTKYFNLASDANKCHPGTQRQTPARPLFTLSILNTRSKAARVSSCVISQSAPMELKLNPKEWSFQVGRVPSIGLDGVLKCMRIEIPLANSSSGSYASLRCLTWVPRYGSNRKGRGSGRNTLLSEDR